jgi:hypothetical protein
LAVPRVAALPVCPVPVPEALEVYLVLAPVFQMEVLLVCPVLAPVVFAPAFQMVDPV